MAGLGGVFGGGGMFGGLGGAVGSGQMGMSSSTPNMGAAMGMGGPGVAGFGSGAGPAGAPGTGGATGPNVPGQAAVTGGGPSVEQMVLDLGLIPPSAMNPQTVAEASRAAGGTQSLYNKWLDSRIASQIQAAGPTQPSGGAGGGGTPTPTTPTIPPVTPAPVTGSPLAGLTPEQLMQLFQGMGNPQGAAVTASPMSSSGGAFAPVQTMAAAPTGQSPASIAQMLQQAQAQPQMFQGLGNPMVQARMR